MLTAVLIGMAMPAMAAVPPDAPAQNVALAAQAPLALPSQAVPAAEAAEQGLRQALQTATWPSDLVRLADEYLQHFAHRPGAAEAVDIRRRAAITAQLLRNDGVQLFRSAFALPSERGLAPDDLRQAALGDASAALRLARQPQGNGGAGSAQVGWLQLAAELGEQRAAYELALHFRRKAQPLMASQYEQRAAQLGFPALPSLDHARK